MTESLNHSEAGSILRAMDAATLTGVLVLLAAVASAAGAVRRRSRS